jgi:hypothetical protein
MPLHVGTSVAFPAYNESDKPPFVDTITASVVREEMTSAGGLGRFRTKVVELDAIRKVHYTFWIADAPPYVIKLQLKGPRGGMLTWTPSERAE